LRQAVNAALQNLGPAPDKDTSLVSVAYQQVYDLPAGVYNVRRVEVRESESEPYNPQLHLNWDERNGKLLFDPWHEPKQSGCTIELTYQPNTVTEPDEDADTISDYIHPDLLKWTAAVHALEWRLRRVEGDDPTVPVLLNRAISQAEIMKQAHPIPKMERDPHLARW
jgi:hypothetical protein